MYPSSLPVAHTCPMHPEVRQDETGICPKCGMGLEPTSPEPPTARTEWVCPMHPEVVRDEPGSCPICGMALEPRQGAAEGDDVEARLVSLRQMKGALTRLGARCRGDGPTSGCPILEELDRENADNTDHRLGAR
jgi:hypothetical protein